MAYSTIAELRANIKTITVARYGDADVTARIAQADKRIESNLSRVINFSLLDGNNTPYYINLLSQYKTAELCLVFLYGAKRSIEEVSDIQYWQNEYTTLLDRVIGGEIDIVDSSGDSIAVGTDVFENVAKPDIEPAMGQGEYGEFLTIEELQDERPIDE
jgi:hypothetical protein